MNKLTLVMLILWVLLALTGVVGLFISCGFIRIAGIVFTCLNAVLALTMLPMIGETIKEIKSK